MLSNLVRIARLRPKPKQYEHVENIRSFEKQKKGFI